MTPQYFIGVDVSKATLDCCVLKGSTLLLTTQIENTPAAIAHWLLTLKATHRAGGKNTVFCLEHMGAYKEHLYQALKKQKALIWLESALHIKRSLGLQRGKSDQLDAQRIALFAYRNREAPRVFNEPRREVVELRLLSSLRQRLLSAITQLKTPTKESAAFIKKGYTRLQERHCKTSIQAMVQDLKQTEATLQEIIFFDERLRRLYEILMSVPGIGPVVATELLIITNEFQNFPTANKLACYCGIAPFEHSSGTSTKGKTRVSKLANRRIRPLLHMAAVSSIRTKGEIREYYERKVQEGKHKLKVINAIKNKIVHRLFACVKEDRLYQKEYLKQPSEVTLSKAM